MWLNTVFFVKKKKKKKRNETMEIDWYGVNHVCARKMKRRKINNAADGVRKRIVLLVVNEEM